MRHIRFGTAVIKQIGPALDKTDGVTIKTALTIGNLKLSIIADNTDGTAPTVIINNITAVTTGSNNDVNYVATAANGQLQVELSATDTARYGSLRVTLSDAANNLYMQEDFEIVPAVTYDALYLGVNAASSYWI